jgi:uncharacterized delta-60 repeat protein
MSMTRRPALALLALLAFLALAAPGALAAGGALRLDPSFGQAGAVTGGRGRGDYREAAGVAVDAQSRVLLAGVGSSGAAVARYLPDGQLDSGYGEVGIAHVQPVAVTSGMTLEAIRGINALAVDSTGRALLLWRGSNLTRLTADGQLDTGFGTGGTAPLGGFHFDDLAALGDGSVLVAGYGYGSPYLVAAKLGPDGSLDPSFGNGGFAVVAIGPRDTNAAARRVALANDGDILLAGFSDGHPALVRLLPDGRPDPGFDHDGRVVAPSWLHGEATALAAIPRGGVLASCNCYRFGSGEALLPVLRYGSRGRLDHGFSDPSLSRLVPKPIRPRALLRSAGRIVLAGGGKGPMMRVFSSQGKPMPHATAAGIPRDRFFGVFGALQGQRPVLAWTPKHAVGEAEVHLAGFTFP